jgi:4-hydroxy-4-methyl-2-oxoglutarate aldolase
MTSTEAAARLQGYGAAVIHEAYGRAGALGGGIRPVWAGASVAGPCRTVLIPPGDNLGIHIALESADPGEVLCVGCDGPSDYGVWGEVATTYALRKRVAGLVTSLGVRDVRAIEALHFPVFASSIEIQGTIKHEPGLHQVPIELGRATVHPGDWIVGDDDGCVVISADRVMATLDAAARKMAFEKGAKDKIRDGLSSRQALGLP